MSKERLKNTLHQGLYFMVVGPFVGLIIILAIIFGSALVQLKWFDLNYMLGLLNASFFLVFFGFIFAYIIGAIPAFITGMVSSLGNTNLKQRNYAITAGSLTCGLLSIVLFNDGYFSNLRETAITTFISCLLGGFSAFICINKRHKRSQKIEAN